MNYLIAFFIALVIPGLLGALSERYDKYRFILRCLFFLWYVPIFYVSFEFFSDGGLIAGTFWWLLMGLPIGSLMLADKLLGFF